ncbi:uncharacterized protein RCC_09219 [Ramularia collo-cygni]|uniref:Profilin n=1 Tax=Ramularia collo-cygni TaxID=112498 RepID=A0A2D3VCQ8_9PEZI|nr:uncharacterized protein RCC_09219 [Ramularia collo-cygni]CZT23505.1 uncharacterized protein RCC_09219 [Ramularia collo-cygni]
MAGIQTELDNLVANEACKAAFFFSSEGKFYSNADFSLGDLSPLLGAVKSGASSVEVAGRKYTITGYDADVLSVADPERPEVTMRVATPAGAQNGKQIAGALCTDAFLPTFKEAANKLYGLDA